MSMPKVNSSNIAKWIGYSLFFALVFGLILHLSGLGEYTNYLKPIGLIFIRLLKMLIIPAVFSSVYLAVTNLGSAKELGTLGKNTMIYYMLTTAIAISIGITFAIVVAPGAGADFQQKIATENSSNIVEAKSLYETIVDVIVTSVPTNPMQAMSEAHMLQVIVFALIFGLIALSYKEESEAVTNFMKSLEKMTHHLAHWVMKLAPIGIFALIVNVVATTGSASLVLLGKYFLVALAAMLLHGFLLILFAAWRINKSPIFVFKNLLPALITAFSTSSSTATLPITTSCLLDNFKAREETTNFVLPLGATVNMDGTAIYVVVATIFIAQVYAIDLGPSQYLIILVTGTMASIGTAGIPGAGLITMGIVMASVGIPLEGIQIVVAVDRILDMFRTSVNILGDSVGTLVIDSLTTVRAEN